MRYVILIVVIAFLAALATYTVLNIDERVTVHLPGVSYESAPQIYLVMAAMAAGFLISALPSLVDGIRLRFQVRKLRRELERQREAGRPFPEAASPAGARAD